MHEILSGKSPNFDRRVLMSLLTIVYIYKYSGSRVESPTRDIT